ncbi:MAG TPA: type IV pilin protein [Methyloprofundus sp.]|uniref:type IV pilin protein n=1 Tax=Methyloprofundus sp. TaxID=2020875 RepID=UPI0017E726E6|nr:type IV pilin protein [Methyloprofundus sp.]MBT5824978.1 type IV pilin protein [Gammaproteobacteria bacterium]MBT6576620.1 type IV pilin protein [Gammaproteobacteria bacterium]MBT7436599.1 type IV pilin protein [Gammaproteobacteria bacterium]HIG64947.1 type IV pilin protein [Methyloprofundus sp.]HIL42562.1 type IV pilin protein [Gammaproteobacteria bacterium]
MNKSRNLGFTLIELMIVVAVIGILLSIAYPSYTEYVLRAKRGDGKAGILRVQLAEEKHRANNVSYGSLAAMDLVASGVTSMDSPDKYYTLTVSGTSGTAYTINAASKFTDDKCGNLSIDQDGTKTESGTDTAANCWGK